MSTNEYEHKSGHPNDPDLHSAMDDFMHAFTEFRDTNDSRLEDIERKMSADIITEEKLARLNNAMDHHQRRMDELCLKAARSPRGFGSTAIQTEGQLQHKSAFDGYVRGGETQGLRALEQKSLSVASDPDGGYLVPEETETTVMQALKTVSPIRAIAGNRQVSGTVYKKPFSISGPGTGWVGETAARPETTSPTLAELSFPTMELYAMPAATSTLLDDSAVNVDEWLAEEVRTAFAAQESAAFVSGDGVNKPKGFLDYTSVAEGSWSWGNTGYLATGVDGDFAASDESDQLIDLIYTLKSAYRANARWVMNRTTQAAIRKFKDADGNYIWQPAPQAGASPSLLGFEVTEVEDMPSIGSDSLSVAFGDFNAGYLVVDRLGLRVLRDPFTAKPYVLFYTTKRVGGGIQDFDAIKFLKFGTS
ncbi:MAG: phage capsid protein [Rhodomicrobium sp.]|nr:MAG: phage capsid protein [Rhodomicrobium sp.]